MTVLRLEPLTRSAIDAAVAQVDEVTLVRRADGAFARVADEGADTFVRALAYAGIDARACDVDLAPPAGMRLAVGRGLTPLPAAFLAMDRVTIRRIPLGEATRTLLRRWPWQRRVAAERRDRCRALLRRADVALGWTRHAWGTAAALRTSEARAALRAVVFDSAGGRIDLERRAFARDGELGRWLF